MTSIIGENIGIATSCEEAQRMANERKKCSICKVMEAEIASLRRQMEYDQRNAAMSQSESAELLDKVEKLEEQLKAKDKELALTKHFLMESGGDIYCLQEQLKAKDEQIASLKEQLKAKDEQKVNILERMCHFEVKNRTLTNQLE